MKLSTEEYKNFAISFFIWSLTVTALIYGTTLPLMSALIITFISILTINSIVAITCIFLPIQNKKSIILDTSNSILACIASGSLLNSIFTFYIAIFKFYLDIIKAILNWALTSLGMIGHGLGVMGAWLATNAIIMGSWIATNTVTIANLFYTAVVAHPAIAIAIPLLVLTASLIIDSCWKFFNSKGAYKVNGSDQPNSVGSDEISQKPDNFLANDTNRTDNSAQPASWPFSYLGF